MINKATYNDIDSILSMTKACANYMDSKRIYQWNNHYPFKEASINDIDCKELYVIKKNWQ